jgi:trehalose 6-phosphate synthase
VLSKGAGSFDDLGSEAVAIVDPVDVQATADALHAAFTMDGERRAAFARRLKKKVTEHEPEDWITSQLDDLQALRDDGEPRSRLRHPRD